MASTRRIAILGAETAAAGALGECWKDRGLDGRLSWLTTSEHLSDGRGLASVKACHGADATVLLSEDRDLVALAEDLVRHGQTVVDARAAWPTAASDADEGAAASSARPLAGAQALRTGPEFVLRSALALFPSPARLSVTAQVLRSAAAYEQAGLEGLMAQTQATLSWGDLRDAPFGRTLAFSAWPLSTAGTAIETSLADLGFASVCATVAMVPAFTGDGAFLLVAGDEASLEPLEASLRDAPHFCARSEPAGLRDVAGRDDIVVSRLPGSSGTLRLWLAWDALRVGLGLPLAQALATD